MRAIQAIKPGGPSVLRETDLPDPTPGPGQVLVRTAAIGINFIDTYRRSGIYTMKFPHVPGAEGAGVIVAVGEDVSDLSEGEHVTWVESVTGSYAELVVVDASQVIRLPTGLPDGVAAALIFQGLTAHYLVRSTFPVVAEDIVLLHAAAGGVGLLATQLIAATGARLIATVSTPAKAELVEGLGLPGVEVLPLQLLHDITTDLPKRVRAATDGLGAHVVFDGVGKDTFGASLNSLRRRGMLVLFGGSSGPVAPFDLQELNAHGSLYITRPTLTDYVASREELTSRSDELFAAVLNGSLGVRIGAQYPLAKASEAHEALEERRTTGKVLLIP